MTDVEDFLAHYGVKGMKWGQRKEYKLARQNFQRLAPEIAARQNARLYESTLSEKDFSKLGTKDTIIKKGSEFKRITSTPESDSKARALFVSTNERDTERYRAILPAASDGGGWPAKSHEGHYEVTLRATKDLKSPSERTRVQAYINLMGTRDIVLSTGEKITGREYLMRQGLGDSVAAMSNRQVALTYYGQLIANQGVRDDPINTAAFRALAKKGYNAVSDDNDRGIIAETPILAFEAQQTLKTMSVQKLSTEDIRRAQLNLKVPD